MLVLPFLLLVACNKEEEDTGKEIAPAVLALTSPDEGGWSKEGDVTAKGTAAHCTDVKVNGKTAKLTDGGFSAPVTLTRGVNIVEATAVDLHGDDVFVRNGVLAGDFEPAKGSIDEAMDVRVNQSGLDKVGDIAEGMLTAETLSSSIGAMNPIFSDDYYVATVNADVTQISFDTADIRFTPSGGSLTLTATLPNFYVALRIYGTLFGSDYDTDMSMSASSAVLTGTVTVAASQGKLGVELLSVDVALNDFAYDLSLIPYGLEDYLFVDTIRDTIIDMVKQQVTDMVPPLLDETLAGLDPSFSTELLGQTVSLAFQFASADIDPDGLALGLDLDVDIPSTGKHEGQGFLSASAGNPDVDTHSDVAAAASDNLLNRVLFEAWDGGMLDMRMSTDDGSLDPLLLLAFKAEEGTITVNPRLPPVAVEANGGLEVQVGEMLITVDTPGGELGEHLVVAVNAFIGVEMVMEDGEIVLELGEPTIVMQVRESDWGASNETITNLITEMLPLDTLLALLGDFSFPIPSLYGIQLDDGTVTRDADGVHTDMKIFLQ